MRHPLQRTICTAARAMPQAAKPPEAAMTEIIPSLASIAARYDAARNGTLRI